MFVSFYYVLGPVESTIKGRIESSTLKNNVLETGKYSLFFTGNTSSLLEAEYYNNQLEKQVETSVCLLGTAENEKYIITDLFFPKIYEQSFNHVSFAPCPKKTIIMFHTHPYRSCLASELDLKTLKENKRKNPSVLMMIMCEERRFNVYG